MPDNEIIKALECCKVALMHDEEQSLYGLALDLITRQKAEIERLKKAKAETIKEFAERLKDKSKKRTQDVYGERVFFGDIDNLVKEMVGDDNG